MATQDTCCSITPYFKVRENQLSAFKKICEEFISLTKTEPKCLYYGFSFGDEQAHCREGYEDAEGLLAHFDNVGGRLHEILEVADLTQLEIHGPEQELAKLRKPVEEALAKLGTPPPQYFVLEYGIRRQ